MDMLALTTMLEMMQLFRTYTEIAFREPRVSSSLPAICNNTFHIILFVYGNFLLFVMQMLTIFYRISYQSVFT